jgi:hypothetical protein
MVHSLNLTPVGDVYVMVVLPGVSAQVCPCWLIDMTKGLLDAQVPLAPVR